MVERERNRAVLEEAPRVEARGVDSGRGEIRGRAHTLAQPALHGGRADPPVHHQAVARQALLDAAREGAVTIRHVLVRPASEPRDIQECVAALQGVVRP